MIEQKKFDFIDALRGIAVLLVVIAHMPIPERFSALNVIGAYGVQLFFIVSAFTLFLSLDAKYRSESRPVLFFTIRRFFRIAPAFYAALAFYLYKNGSGPSVWAPEGIGLRQIGSTLLFVNGWDPRSINSIVPGGWSIAAEMNFYLMVPLCFRIISNAYRAFFLAVALAAIAMFSDHLMLPYLLTAQAGQPTIIAWFPLLWFPAQACVFPIGFLLFHLFKNGNERLRDRGIAAGILCAAIYLIAICARTQFASIPNHFVAAAALGLGFYALSARSFAAFVNPLTCFFGKISFSMYLFHFWAIDIVSERLAPFWASANPTLGAFLFFVCTVAITGVIASITYEIVEKPGQLLGRIIIQKIDRNEKTLLPAG
jgi:peptidoglycan/LPS O-acetylase OafA/YrhL